MKYQKLQYLAPITCYEHCLAYTKLTQNNFYAYNLNLVKWNYDEINVLSSLKN